MSARVRQAVPAPIEPSSDLARAPALVDDESGQPRDRSHGSRPMKGRDPYEKGRAATPLELLYDLVTVVAIGQASSLFAHSVAEGHFAAAIGGFAFAMFAVLWAWINFSWFASAFDTDDWIYRLAVMVQMVGVTIVSLGLPPMFHSIEAGHAIDNVLMVVGYVILRTAMVFLWIRAARHCTAHRSACGAYARTVVAAQIGWVALALLPIPLEPEVLLIAFLVLVELAGPYWAETRHGGTPWHAHHMAERYGLLGIIALGEGVIGTVSSLSAAVQAQGWTLETGLVALSGMGLTFGMWWCYFLLPTGEMLYARRERAFLWGYGSLPLLVAIAATGAGLHVAALYIEHKTQLGPVATVLAITIPVAAYLVGIYVLYIALFADIDPFHALLVCATLLILVAAPFLAASGVAMTICLLVLMLAPLVTVVGYETRGHRHIAIALERALQD